MCGFWHTVNVFPSLFVTQERKRVLCISLWGVNSQLNVRISIEKSPWNHDQCRTPPGCSYPCEIPRVVIRMLVNQFLYKPGLGLCSYSHTGHGATCSTTDECKHAYWSKARYIFKCMKASIHVDLNCLTTIAKKKKHYKQREKK